MFYIIGMYKKNQIGQQHYNYPRFYRGSSTRSLINEDIIGGLKQGLSCVPEYFIQPNINAVSAKDIVFTNIRNISKIF